MDIITLQGSCDIVCEFFEFALNSILYQRGLYASDAFIQKKKYNLSLYVCQDEVLSLYLKKILHQVNIWIKTSEISRLVLVITNKDTQETIERWAFEIVLSQDRIASKTLKDIQNEISIIIKQITSSVTFLPILDNNATFNILAYTDKNTNVPELWVRFFLIKVDSDARMVKNPEVVFFRSFSTQHHKVGGLVTYQLNE